MDICSKSRIFAAAFVAAMIHPGSVTAGSHFSGVWQPYSMPAVWRGAMTVAPDRVSFSEGPEAMIESVRSGGSVFRIIDPQDDSFLVCGDSPANYIGFHVLDDGMLAFLTYRTDAPPEEPMGGDMREATRNGACSVMAYSR